MSHAGAYAVQSDAAPSFEVSLGCRSRLASSWWNLTKASLLEADHCLLCRSGKCAWPVPHMLCLLGFADLSRVVDLFSSRRLGSAFHIPGSYMSENLRSGFQNNPTV